MTTDEAYLGSPDNPRTTALVSYITFIGWLIAYFALYPSNKTRLSAFHLRQSLLIHILSFILKVAFSFTLQSALFIYILIIVLSIGLFIIWLLGFIDAMNGKEKPAPVIGRSAQKIFQGL